ncbi:hypothetical protein [Streptomyces tricolor]|uniref:hypothetical protein n=1 Tax=Streptomyces tricolor TaxID=68277 RepID=UPI0036E881A1
MLYRTALAALVLITAASLTACGGNDTKPTAKAKPTPIQTIAKEDKFLDAVHLTSWQSWQDTQPADGELIEFPQMWCEGLTEGHSVAFLFSEGGLYPSGRDWGTRKAEANELLLMGVKAYCPDKVDEVTQELRDSGEY